MIIKYCVGLCKSGGKTEGFCFHFLLNQVDIATLDC